MRIIPTGIPVLDEILDGGLTEGSLTLISGYAGSGKSTLASQIAYNYVKNYGQPVLYVNFTESKDSFYLHMSKFGFNFKEYEEKGLFHYIEAVPGSLRRTEELLARLKDFIKEKKVSMLIIDSVSAMLAPLEINEARRLFTSIINHLTRIHKVTVIATAEMRIGEERVGMGFEEFIADNIFVLSFEERDNLIYRKMEIRKTRFSHTERIRFEFILSDEGIRIYSPLIKEYEHKFSGERLPTGIRKLDDMLGGGLVKGCLAIFIGPVGTGKSLVALSVAVTNAILGKKSLFISFMEGEEQLKFRSRMMFGDISILESNGRLKFSYINPVLYTVGTIIHKINQLIEETKPDVLIVDSLHMIKLAHRGINLPEFLYLLRHLIRSNDMVGLITIVCNAGEAVCGEYSSMADIVVLFELRRVDDEAERTVLVIKSIAPETYDKPSRIIIKDWKIDLE